MGIKWLKIYCNGIILSILILFMSGCVTAQSLRNKLGVADASDYYSGDPSIYTIFSSSICFEAYSAKGLRVFRQTILGAC